MIAVGTDIVHIPEFARQLELPGSKFGRVFSDYEWRIARGSDKGTGIAQHLAGRWAAKEAFVKAWAQARYGQAPVMKEQDLVWSDISVRRDRWGRVAIDLASGLEKLLASSLGSYDLALSISHDGDYATATCVVSGGSQ